MRARVALALVLARGAVQRLLKLRRQLLLLKQLHVALPQLSREAVELVLRDIGRDVLCVLGLERSVLGSERLELVTLLRVRPSIHYELRTQGSLTLNGASDGELGALCICSSLAKPDA